MWALIQIDRAILYTQINAKLQINSSNRNDLFVEYPKTNLQKYTKDKQKKEDKT